MSGALQFCESALLSAGDRIKHRRHPELTGRVKHYEYARPGILSALPYNVEWDNNSRAFDVLGMFWIYASDASIEAAS